VIGLANYVNSILKVLAIVQLALPASKTREGLYNTAELSRLFVPFLLTFVNTLYSSAVMILSDTFLRSLLYGN